MEEQNFFHQNEIKLNVYTRKPAIHGIINEKQKKTSTENKTCKNNSKTKLNMC